MGLLTNGQGPKGLLQDAEQTEEACPKIPVAALYSLGYDLPDLRFLSYEITTKSISLGIERYPIKPLTGQAQGSFYLYTHPLGLFFPPNNAAGKWSF